LNSYKYFFAEHPINHDQSNTKDVFLFIYFILVVHCSEKHLKGNKSALTNDFRSNISSVSSKHFVDTHTLKGPSKTVNDQSIGLGNGLSNIFMQLVAGVSATGYLGDGGPATSAGLLANIPWVDSLGQIYIPDGTNFNIRKVDTNGIISLFGGTGSRNNLGVTDVITSAGFHAIFHRRQFGWKCILYE
jgi:hypothetical protein